MHARRRHRQARARRRGIITTATAIGLLALTLGLAGCGGSAPRPQTTLTAFLSAWSRGDWTAMRAQVADPPPDFTTVNSEVFSALGVSRVSLHAGVLQTSRTSQSAAGRTASALVAATYTLSHVGTWRATSTVHLVEHDRVWKVVWSPATIDRSLHAGEQITVSRVSGARGRILGAGGAPLTRSGSQVIVGVVASRIKSIAAVRADLLAAGAPSAAITQALAEAKRSPADFEPVFTVSAARFAKLRAAAGPDNVYRVPGTTFQPSTRTSAITAQLGAHVVGSLGPITAQELGSLGFPYTASSVIGQSGLQQSQQRTLAGTPSTQINVTDSGGNAIARLATYPGQPGHDVRTSLDPRVQRAAEAALATSTRPDVSMVALQASTGRVLALVSDPVSTDDDTALEGAYPPGSTFKVITATALFTKGLTPASPASCPSTISIDGESFHNAGDEAPTPTITQAFIESCNTAFIGLATAHLSAGDYPAAAELYDLNMTPRLGLDAFYANVRAPSSATALAADAFGQGNLTFSPLGMATVAAAIDTGVVRAPTLVQATAAAAQTAPHRLPAAVVDGLRPMMLGVVQSGTAEGTGLPAGTHAKTGTAEYGTGPEASHRIDGWLMGYDGNVAFAIVTHNTGGADGGPVDGPIIARFLDALHGSS